MANKSTYAPKNTGQSFITGTLIITVTGIIVKVISMLFRIPLDNLIGAVGMGYYGVAYTVYNLMVVIATSGLSVAISKIVAESIATGKTKDIKTVLKVAFSTFIVIGGILTLFVFFFSGWFARILDSVNSGPALMAVAPAIFVVTVTSVIKGYFQGHSDMMPTSIANLIEVVVKLVCGLGFAYYMQAQGASLPVVVASAVIGVTMGSVIALFYLLIRFFRDKKRYNVIENPMEGDSYKQMMSRFLWLVIPIAIGSITSNLANLIDTGMVFSRLQTIPGITEETASYMYGVYSSKAETVFHLPVTILLSVCVPVIPAVASAYVVNNMAKVHSTINASMKICMFLAMPCAVGLCVLAEPILALLYSDPEEVALAAKLLSVYSPALIFVCVAQLITPILQAIGKTYTPVKNIIIASIIKIALNYFLLSIESINIMGAVISNTVMYAILMVLNYFSLYRLMRMKLDFLNVFIKPIIGALACGAAAFMCYYFTNSALGSSISCLLSILVAAVVYFVLVLSMRVLNEDDIELLPKSKKIKKLLEKLHWVG